ncbi:carbohydrate ABC transporter substrate-binding protein (CUT1 family) [Halanaerobium saccharolyticum]|uniref:Carbohydrate ABC transporter substrate-binding protein (CUT1 family) n=1 Tax=Halanaerobium saccharolyticum TaxID=43595 RepID=A0A4R6LZ12_9FIRM|nr:extracellular solute-binding protein [Halanaerobium saccharolyticum]TDO94121.1 carbohydrate ABC transporter substrate-binding protein (CUT1 family) [Halanaerobium saccharolyticum]
MEFKRGALIFIFLIFSAVFFTGIVGAESWADGGYYGPDISGKTVTVLTLDGELSDGVKAQIPEFEARTGAVVELVPTPAATFNQELFTNLAAGSAAYDVIIFHADFSTTLMRSGWLEPLNKYINDPDIADPNLNIDDFLEPPFNIYKDDEGDIYALPYKGDAYIYFYRKDLINDPDEKEKFKEEYGYELQPAETWQQYMDIAEFFQRPEENLYGSVYTAEKGSFLVFYLAMRMYAQDTKFFDENMQPQLTTPEAVKAAEALKWEMENSTPPNITDVTFDQMNSMFAEGEIAQIIQWPGVAKVINNEETSNVIDKVGTANLPSWTEDGPSGDIMGGWFAHVSNHSQNKVAAYKFIEWATSGTGEKIKIPAGNDPVRKSTLNELRNERPMYDALKNVLLNANTLPKFPEWNEFQQVLINQLHSYITGSKTVNEALESTQNQWETKLEDYGYIE